MFELENIKRPETLTDLERAARYFYIQRLCFGGKPVCRTYGATVTGTPRLNISAIEERLIEVHWRLEKVAIENLDVCRCVEMYDRKTTLFYLDPPYYGTAGYSVPFKAPDYDRVVQVLKGISGRFILSINDVPETRALFKDFEIRTAKVKYCVGRSAASRKPDRGELLVTNFSGPMQPSGSRPAPARKSPSN